MDEDKDGCGFASAAVDIEPFDFAMPVSDALGLADAPARQFALADAALDQLLAVRRIGGLVIGRVECGLVIVEEYRRAFIGHRTPAICTATCRFLSSFPQTFGHSGAWAQPASPEPMHTGL